MRSTTRLISKGVPSNQMGSQMKRWNTSSSMHQLLVLVRLRRRFSLFRRQLQERVRGFPSHQRQMAPDQDDARHGEVQGFDLFDHDRRYGEQREAKDKSNEGGHGHEFRTVLRHAADQAAGEPQVEE